MREKPERYDYRAFLYVLVACLIETAGFFYALFFGGILFEGIGNKGFLWTVGVFATSYFILFEGVF